ncbi:MAG: glycosyltransferase family 2 protein [Oscillospiraceae bacterium]|nr:glycosyltransferase family 2 protein [Oscillospiraceae bacterium]
MKARIVQFVPKCTLSIGMIVKNEEKYLEKCLKSIKPLLDEINSELIIVDTGSTDKTVEIAERFTNKIYHFEWVNDFSAARNFAMDKCRGEWFMYLDADEIFDEDLSEMVSFFKNDNLRAKYNAASYILYNYTNPEGSDYLKSIKYRLVRRTNQTRFENPIHEYIPNLPPPYCHFTTFAHHWGYAHETVEQRKTKRNRNMILLEQELEKKPDDLRTLLHMSKELEIDELHEFLPKFLQSVRKKLSDPLAPVAFVTAIVFNYAANEFDKAQGYIDEYFKHFKFRSNSVLTLEVLVCKGLIFHKQEKFDEAIEAYEEYFKFYKLYTEDKLTTHELGDISLSFHEPEEYVNIKNNHSTLLSKTGRAKISFKEGITKVSIGQKPPANTQEAILAVFSEAPQKITQYVRTVLLKFNAEQMVSVIDMLKFSLKNYAEITLSYCTPEDFSSSLPELFWAATAYSAAITNRGNISEEESSRLCENFAHFTSLYTANAYNHELLNDSDISALPELHRVGYYIALMQNVDTFSVEEAASQCVSYASVLRELAGK